MRTTVARRAERLAPHDLAARAEHELARAPPKPPPTTISSGSKMLTNETMPAPRWRPIPRAIARARSSPSSARRTSRCASAAGPNASCARRVAACPRDVRLEMAAAGAGAQHGAPVVDDDDVPELGAGTVAPRNGSPPSDRAPPPTPVPSVSITRSLGAAAGADAPLGDARRRWRRCRSPREAEALDHPVAEVESASGMFTEPTTRRRAGRCGDGTPKPTPRRRRRSAPRRPPRAARATSSCESGGVGRSCADRPTRRASTSPARIFVPPRSTPIAGVPPTAAGTLTRRMARGEKPYRVYRGGRAKGKVPLDDARRARAAERADDGRRRRPATRRPRAGQEPRRKRWRGALDRASLARAAPRPSSSGGSPATSPCERRERGERAAPRGHEDGARAAGRAAALEHATNILLLGTDHSTTVSRAARRPALRLDHADAHRPGPHRLVYLSIPRDLRVAIPGLRRRRSQRGDAVRAAPQLAIRTIRDFTRTAGQPRRRRRLRRVPAADRRGRRRSTSTCRSTILSNRFDCPYARARAARVGGLALPQGHAAHGRAPGAHLLAHPREPAQPGDTDISRGQRQQDVMQATLRKLASPCMFFRLPFSGGDAVEAARDRHVDAGSSCSSAG